VWASRRQAALLALSGKDGHLLWRYPPADPKKPAVIRKEDRDWLRCTGTVVGVPAVADVDRDGTPDVVAAFVRQEQEGGPVERWVEALSGRTGKSLWRYPLDGGWFNPPAGAKVPHDAAWFPRSGMSFGGTYQWNPQMLFALDYQQRQDQGPPLPYAATVVRMGKRPLLALVAGTRLVGLDVATGEPAWAPHDLGFWPVRPPQFADLDGDGQADVLLLRQDSVDRMSLIALALNSRKTMWEAKVGAVWGRSWYEDPADWPLLADLDGDGKLEVVTATADFTPTSKWSGVEVHDGATGALRWQRRLVTASRWGQLQQVNRMIVGPDLDGDGHREVFTAVLDGDEPRRERNAWGVTLVNIAGLSLSDRDFTRPVVWIDALSGQDGHGIWWSRQRPRGGSLTNHPGPHLGPLRWWQPGGTAGRSSWFLIWGSPRPPPGLFPPGRERCWRPARTWTTWGWPISTATVWPISTRTTPGTKPSLTLTCSTTAGNWKRSAAIRRKPGGAWAASGRRARTMMATACPISSRLCPIGRRSRRTPGPSPRPNRRTRRR
jgi:hypothetical protein